LILKQRRVEVKKIKAPELEWWTVKEHVFRETPQGGVSSTGQIKDL
jgi:hypothetical protein